MTQEPILSLRGVNAYYDESHILHDVSFDLFKGEIVGILGRNGVGKTTTLQTILGLTRATGEIHFNGASLRACTTSEIVRKGIGWVPQGHRIFPTLSVIENLELAALHARPGIWSLGTIYELFPRLYARRSARGDVLSGGEQQMLAIARALIQNPDVFLMDEPSEGLSPAIVHEVGHLIRRLNREGVSILLVEQKLAFALEVVDRIIIMNKGTIVYSGQPADIERDPEIGVRFLGMGVTLAREEGAS